MENINEKAETHLPPMLEKAAAVIRKFKPLNFFLLVLNIPLFLFGLKKQGIHFTVYAIFAVSVYSFSAWLITDILPIDASVASPLAGTDLLLCALFGGLISGIGMITNTVISNVA